MPSSQKVKTQRIRRLKKQARKLGLCPGCLKCTPQPGYKVCDDCRIVRNLAKKKQRERKKKIGICVGCTNKALEGKVYCKNCSNKYTKLSKKRRARKKIEGECLDCPADRAPELTRCTTCVFKRIAKAHLGSAQRWKDLEVMFANQQEICPFMGEVIRLGFTATIDHRVASSKGGNSELSNLHWTHFLANNAKGNLSEGQFLSLVKIIYEYRKLQTFVPVPLPTQGFFKRKSTSTRK